MIHLDSTKDVLRPDINVSDETRCRIKTQKVVALDLITKVRKLICSSAMITGGAPRNWWFNREAKDIDIILEAPARMSQATLMEGLEILGVEKVFNMATHTAFGVKRDNLGKHKGNYGDRMSDIQCVLEGVYLGEKVQFIYTLVSTYGYMETHFDTSINMIFAVPSCGGLSIRDTNGFRATIKTGAIFVYPNQTAYASDHLLRMHEYFPECPLVNHEYKEKYLKNPNIRACYHSTVDELMSEVAKVQNIKQRDVLSCEAWDDDIAF